MKTRTKMPDNLTLVSSGNSITTVTIGDEYGKLVLYATNGPNRIAITLSELQAGRLRSRINKFFRENR